MTADPWSEDAQGLWQSQESMVTRLSAEDMRMRAERWNRESRATNWIAFVCAAVLGAFFAWMLIVDHTTLQRIGATIGLAAAAHLVFVGLRVARGRWLDEGATCLRAYKLQLQRRFVADQGSARTILLSLTGCALLAEPGNWAAWGLTAGSQLAAGLIAYVYFTRQARRFQARVEELTRLEGD